MSKQREELILSKLKKREYAKERKESKQREERVSKGKKRESATGIRGYRERGKLKTRQQFEKV